MHWRLCGRFEFGPVGYGIEAAVGGVVCGRAVVFIQAFEAGGHEVGIGGGLVFHEVPINDKAFGLFGEIKPVPEFNLGPGFAADDNVDVWIVEAEDLVGIVDAAFAYDSFVGLLKKGSEKEKGSANES